jgi:hypothetical protein
MAAIPHRTRSTWRRSESKPDKVPAEHYTTESHAARSRRRHRGWCGNCADVAASTCNEYATTVFAPYVLKHLETTRRVDLVWGVYKMIH